MSGEANRTRTVRKTLSFTPQEWEAVQRRMEIAGSRSFEGFARSVILDGKISVQRVAFDPRPMRLELARIGNNVNQIARAVNINDAVTYDEMRETRRLLGHVQKLIERASRRG